MRKPSVLVIFLTVFIDLIGFGIIVPMLPIYARHLNASGFISGVIFAAFSAMTFVFSPVWGRLSDRHGRRPMLLISTAGAAVSYALFALGSGLANPVAALWVIFLSRVFAGICGGNITVAQAYIADVTPAEQRSKKMGLIGMAFGLGFICGPIIGGISLKKFGGTGPGWVAAALCAANFILAWFILVESLKPSSEHVEARPRLTQWAHTLNQPKVGLLVVVFFLATFCFSCFESTLTLLISDNFHLDVRQDETSASTVIFLFAYCGIIGALVQGMATGRLVKKLGEPRVIALSLVCTGISLALVPFIKGHGQLSWRALMRQDGLPWLGLLGTLALVSIGSMLTRPPLFGLLSILTPAHEQGATLGIAQSAGSLARIVGPLFALTALDYAPAVPYLTCTVVLLVTTAIVVQRLCRQPDAVATTGSALSVQERLTPEP